MSLFETTLALLATSLWAAYVVLPEFGYEKWSAAAFVAACIIAILFARAMGRAREIRPYVQPTPASRAQAEGTQMNQESPFQKFLGVMASTVALAIAAGVVVYFYYVFWAGRALDFDLMVYGQKIPAETYPFILYTAWTLSQTAMAYLRPKEGALGHVFWWLDIGSSVLVFVYLAVTLIQAIASGNNPSFIIVLVAFTAHAFVDTLLHGRGVFGASGEIAESIVMPARRGDGAGIVVTGNAGRDINIYPAGSKVRMTVDDTGARVTAVEPAAATEPAVEAAAA